MSIVLMMRDLLMNDSSLVEVLNEADETSSSYCAIDTIYMVSLERYWEALIIHEQVLKTEWKIFLRSSQIKSNCDSSCEQYLYL